jgi:hypothetical protein
MGDLEHGRYHLINDQPESLKTPKMLLEVA